MAAGPPGSVHLGTICAFVRGFLAPDRQGRWAAAAAAPGLATPSIQKTAPGWENTMAVKDRKVSKLRPKTP